MSRRIEEKELMGQERYLKPVNLLLLEWEERVLQRVTENREAYVYLYVVLLLDWEEKGLQSVIEKREVLHNSAAFTLVLHSQPAVQ